MHQVARDWILVSPVLHSVALGKVAHLEKHFSLMVLLYTTGIPMEPALVAIFLRRRVETHVGFVCMRRAAAARDDWIPGWG